MTSVLLILHLFVTLALIGVVLIQRSEGGGLGIGSTQGMGSFMSGRGTANLLTRTTAILAALFMALSLALALLNHGTIGVGRTSILDRAPPVPAPVGAPASSPGAGTSVPAAVEPGAPSGPSTPGPSTPGPLTPGSSAPAPVGAAPAPPSGSSVPTN